MDTERAIKDEFRDLDLDVEATQYLDYNAKRFAHLLATAATLRQSMPSSGVTIMDVGPSFFTELLRRRFPEDTILSLGLTTEEARGGHLPKGLPAPGDTHVEFDLNDAGDRETWPDAPACDLIVMAEVLEHLYTSPTQVLGFVASCLRPGGYLVLTTPNAAALNKRLALLRGKHPYEMIRDSAENPGHYREYTRQELCAVAAACGLSVRRIAGVNYLYGIEFEAYHTLKGRVMRWLLDCSPPTLRAMFDVTLQRPPAP